VQLAGANFVPASSARFNGTGLAVTYLSPTQLSVVIPSSLLTIAPASKAANLVVSNPSPGGGDSGPASFGVASATSTLSGNVQPLFTARCATAGCHSAGSSAGSLSLVSGQSYAALVGVSSSQCGPIKRVLACGPARSKSVLIDKIVATTADPACSGTRMPKSVALSASEQQVILDWVAQGAPP
jgi:hypothetical protein